ncbi:hypothetical protein [Sedimentitalea nanhaiensis]|uniref:Porin n=1 Tax=Sedimentitalea nanhaiensis TaxID=999627 RepID=A0A1I7CSV2_9RHOB|nr:hypothetical protein [Sedimentitalea nanhaiensis]SFU02488.1 hypothetical protein SAMN05216236_11955 [Sedimentitalea nanhaiensis]
MNKGLIASAALAGGVLVALSPALAQDEEEFGTLRQRLRVEQEFGVGENLGLEVPSEGSTSLSTTRLTYGLETKTRIQELALTVGGALRFGSVAEGNTLQTGFTDPLIGLRYLRDTGNADFSVDLDYRQSDISLTAPLWTFLDQDGIIRPPRDFGNIRGSGERRAYNVDTQLELGKNAPVGLRFTAGTNGVNYIDATDTSLTDSDYNNLGLSALFRFNPVTTGYIDLYYQTYKNKDTLSTDRVTETVQAGFDRVLSARSSLGFRFGYTDVDTTTTNPFTGIDSLAKQSGPSGNISYVTELPNGDFATTFDLSQNSEGQRGTLRFSRSMALPTGSLSANVGLTSFDSSDPQVIGGITWLHEMPRSSFNLRLNRDVYTDENDEDRFSNYLVAGYKHDINAVSYLTADLSLSYNESTASQEATHRATAVLVYNHTLTRDWSMNAGIEYNMLDEDPQGRADSTAVFFGIARNFDLSN